MPISDLASIPIPIAGDHAAPELKAKLIAALKDYVFEDLGPSGTESVDYPDYAAKVAARVSEGKAPRGILICGSGIGMAIAANKFPGVRAAQAESLTAARLSREHNDANILCLGARLTPPDLAIEMVRTWLTTEFSNQPRHCGRVEKIAALEARLAQKRKD
jgi:ribose 5-phosphate isomerase B